MGVFTTPANPAAMAAWSAGESVTFPVTFGANRLTIWPVGVTIADATCGWYRVPPLANVA